MCVLRVSRVFVVMGKSSEVGEVGVARITLIVCKPSTPFPFVRSFVRSFVHMHYTWQSTRQPYTANNMDTWHTQARISLSDAHRVSALTSRTLSLSIALKTTHEKTFFLCPVFCLWDRDIFWSSIKNSFFYSKKQLKNTLKRDSNLL